MLSILLIVLSAAGYSVTSYLGYKWLEDEFRKVHAAIDSGIDRLHTQGQQQVGTANKLLEKSEVHAATRRPK